MPVPDFWSLMLPILKTLAETDELHISAVRERVAKAQGLSNADLRERLPSGQTRFANRIGWALTHLAARGRSGFLGGGGKAERAPAEYGRDARMGVRGAGLGLFRPQWREYGSE